MTEDEPRDGRSELGDEHADTERETRSGEPDETAGDETEPPAESRGSEDTEAETPEEETGARDRIEAGADRAVNELDTRVIDILSWLLDTETRGRIYVYLRQDPWSTSEEVAEGTGLYPSTVREALAELADEEIVERRKRESEGAGNNPFEYKSIAPSDLVGSVVGRVQEELNTVFTMDLRGAAEEEETPEPVQIEVREDTEESAE
ncbi:MAG: winged helix-turn-helix domain-containing protein [Halodesulfurarchaeum sp.]|nr:winged helix-turn-helix domain-containing protein [Halodesulfurarchaeum sp.]